MDGKKNNFFVVVIGYDKNGHMVACDKGLRDTVVKVQAMPLKVSTNTNLATKLGEYYIAQYCETYKRAVELSDSWNDDFKNNGSYFDINTIKQTYTKDSHITNVDEVKNFFYYSLYDRNITLHPDDSLADFSEEQLKQMNVTKDEAVNYDRLMDECFEVCKRENADIYDMYLDEYLPLFKKALNTKK